MPFHGTSGEYDDRDVGGICSFEEDEEENREPRYPSFSQQTGGATSCAKGYKGEIFDN